MLPQKSIIGMLHLPALPATPKYQGDLKAIVKHVCHEAQLLESLGFDALIIENMHDIPYTKPPIDPVITASMSVIASQVRQAVELPLGIQVLAAGNCEALAIAKASELQFIRAEGFVFSHVADEGFIDGCAGALMRYRKHIDAEMIAVWTDIKKKHAAHALTQDISIAETAKAAEFFLSDGLIITGSSTGEAVDHQELLAVHEASHTPVYLGSGVKIQNMSQYFPYADGFIVGSALKKEGQWHQSIDPKQAEKLVSCFRELRA